MDELNTALLAVLHKTDVISAAQQKRNFSSVDVCQWLIAFSIVLGELGIFKQKATVGISYT